MLLLLPNTLKSSRNIQGFDLIRAVLLFLMIYYLYLMSLLNKKAGCFASGTEFSDRIHEKTTKKSVFFSFRLE